LDGKPLMATVSRQLSDEPTREHARPTIF